MPYSIRKTKGGKYQVIKQDGSKVFGTHESRSKAIRQLRAIEINSKEKK